MQSRLKLGDYEEWNKEGFSFLASDVYTADLRRGETPSKKYQKSSFAVGQEQLALAGYRLGATLNATFGSN